jgi:hypothetical protein
MVAVVWSNLEPMTSRIPKASSRTKSISLSSHNVNPSQVYHNLESFGLFKSKAGRSVSQADVQRFSFHSAITRPSLIILLACVVGALELCSTSFLLTC